MLTAEEAEKLIKILRASGVRSYRDGDFAIELAPTHRIDKREPSPDEVHEILRAGGAV